MPRHETQPIGVRQRRAGEARAQQRLGLVMVQMRARIDIAVAGAVLERDAPLPPRLARGCTREGRGIALAFARHRDRAVAGEPVVPFGIAGVERAFDEQAAKARAVGEVRSEAHTSELQSLIRLSY